MRRLGLAAAVVLMCAAGCTHQRIAEDDRRHTLLLDTPAAMHCLASARDYGAYADELERDVREQKAMVTRLKVRVQEVFGEAGRVRFNKFLTRNVREAEALNLEGEGRRMRAEIRNREKLIGVLANRAAWYRRRSQRESRRIDQIMHNDIPVR